VQDVPANNWLNWNPEISAKLIKPENNFLACWYMNEKKKEKSKLQKYLDSLPTDF
jgi:hypothetical protein